MDKLEVLKETNRLVAAGLRKSAIDLIQEYLESIPNDPAVLRALGRIYLLEKKPDLAVKYLQLSLKNIHSEPVPKDIKHSYELDNLNSDDLAYIDETAQTTDIEYIYPEEDIPFKIFDTTTERLNNSESSVVATNIATSVPIDNQIDGFISNPIVSDSAVSQLQPIAKQPSSIDRDGFQRENQNKNSANSDDINNADLIRHQENILDQPNNPVPSTEFLQKDLFNDKEFVIDDYDDVGDEIEEFETQTDAELEKIHSPEIDDPYIENDFDWDDLDDFDEHEPFETNDNLIQTVGKLERSVRAKQIAAEVIQAHDCDLDMLPLLQQVFSESGWAAARVAIERELDKGLSREELELAIYIRSLWTENQQYWISFLDIKSNFADQVTRAAYKNMSWPESLRIVRSFNNVPSQEEIEYFIDELYDDWYCNSRLQKQFKTFIRYLKYRTGSVRRSLPGNELFSFIDTCDHEYYLDSGYDFIKHDPNIEALKEEGIDIERMLVGIEQKYFVIRPEGNFGDPDVYGDR